MFSLVIRLCHIFMLKVVMQKESSYLLQNHDYAHVCHETGRSIDPGASTVVILCEEAQSIWGKGTPNSDCLWAVKKIGISSLMIKIMFVYTNLREILACFTVECFLYLRLVALMGLAGLPLELQKVSHTTRALPGNSSWTGYSSLWIPLPYVHLWLLL